MHFPMQVVSKESSKSLLNYSSLKSLHQESVSHTANWKDSMMLKSLWSYKTKENCEQELAECHPV